MLGMLMGACVLCLLAVINFVDAASFNCLEAKKETEKAICSDSLLEQKDEELSHIYVQLKKSLPKSQVSRLQAEQIQWLSYRNNQCASNIECLKRVYEDRISELRFRMSPEYAHAPAVKIAGDYVNGKTMSLTVRALSKDRVMIRIDGAELPFARWICSFEGAGQLQNHTVTVISDHTVPVTFVFNKNAVEVKTNRTDDPFCGYGGSIRGTYLKKP